jgi:hypothetical protein
MPTFRVLVEVEYENEIPEGSKQIAADIGAQAIANSVEESGGGQTSAKGVIEGGRQQP